MKYFIPMFLILAGCGSSTDTMNRNNNNGVMVANDGVVVKGSATFVVEYGQNNRYEVVDNNTNVTYTNAASTTFTINVSSFVPGAFTGDTLSLGSVSIASLSDNNLKVCNPGGNTKCTQAIIRVYTTGTVAGFVNTADQYGAPVFAGTLNPTTQVGLNAAGSIQVQTYTIPSTVHKLSLSNFPSPTYSVNSDFSNAGSGAYSMVFVVEYALAP